MRSVSRDDMVGSWREVAGKLAGGWREVGRRLAGKCYLSRMGCINMK